MEEDKELELMMATPDNLQGEALVDFEQRRLDGLLSKRQEVESRVFVVKRNRIPMFIEFMKLKSGRTFGEQALLAKSSEPMLRAATIRCSEDCHFAVMSKESFQNILKSKIQKTKLEQMAVLQNLPFFRVWTKNQLLKVVNFIIEPKNFVKNQVVFREGDPADTIFIVQAGDFEASRRYQPQVDYSKLKQEEVKAGRPSDAGTQVIIDRQVRSVETFKLVLMGPG